MGRNTLRFAVAGIGMLALTAPPAAQQQQPQQQPQQQQQQQQQQQKQKQGGDRVDLDQLENAPEKFVGKTVTVEGEVDRVLGPHLFTIDERDWADLERELPVVVPEPFAALVKSDAPVRVTGTVQKVPIAQIERERGFLTDEKIRAEIETKPVLVATEVVATQTGVTLRARADQPVGTSGGGAAVTDVDQLTQAKDTNLVGRRVDLKNAVVTGVTDQGFWIRTPSGERIYVMTAAGKPTVKEGQTAAVQGVVLELPDGMQVKIDAKGEEIYIFADSVMAK